MKSALYNEYICIMNTIFITRFYKQLVCKQLAFGWKIANQIVGLNPFSLSNNKNYRLSKRGDFPLYLSQKYFWEKFKITDHKYRC